MCSSPDIGSRPPRGAVVQQRLRATTSEVVRQQLRFGASAPTLLRAFRDHGVPKPDNRAAVRRWSWLATHVGDLARSPGLRRQWIRRGAFRLGRLWGSVRERTLCL